MADRTFTLKVVGDIVDAQRSLKNLDQNVSGFGDKAKGLAKGVGAYFAADAIVGFGKSVIDAASDAEQALGASQSVFGDYAGEIEAFSKSTAENMGIAGAEFLQLGSLTGSLLKNQGVPLDEAASATERLTERAADLAAMYGGDVSSALEAINSGLKGELDPLEAFGVSLKASTVEAKAQAMGLVDADGKATDYGKTMAAVQLIMDQSASSAGTFARESDTLAGRSAIMKAQFADLQAELGEKLLPVMAGVLDVIVKVVEFVSANQDWLVPLVAGIGVVVAGVKAWTLAQAALNIVLALNPIGLIVLAIGALVTGLVLAWQHSETFRDIVTGAFEVVKELAQNIVDGVIAIGEWLAKVPGWFMDGVNFIKDVGLKVIEIITFPYRKAFELVISAGMKILEWFREVPGIVNDLGHRVFDIVTYPYRTAFNAVLELGKVLLDWFWRLPGRISDFFGNVADVITRPFEIAFGWVADAWNNTVGGFGFEIPGWVPGIGGRGFHIPYMAEGGIVTGPMIAMLGEAGPEAVIPLDRLGGMAGGNVIYLTVQSLNPTAETGRVIAESLAQYDRSAGTSIVGYAGRAGG